MEETKQVLQARSPSEDPDTPLKGSEASKMEYLRACIKEAFRYHPPLSQLLPRTVPQGGATILGRYFRPGVAVACNAWTVHRDKDLYGENANEY